LDEKGEGVWRVTSEMKSGVMQSRTFHDGGGWGKKTRVKEKSNVGMAAPPSKEKRPDVTKGGEKRKKAKTETSRERGRNLDKECRNPRVNLCTWVH